MTAPAEIFKAYDVRGLYGDEIDGDVAYAVGRAFVRVLGGSRPRVGLGRDMRLTAPELAARYRDGMVAEGAHVLDAGMVGTEMLYWLVGSHELDGGLMCTASHNPKAYTGAKLVEKGAVALSGDTGIGEIRDLVDRRARRSSAAAGRSRRSTSTRTSSAPPCASSIPRPIKPLKVVVDGGNGMAGPMVGPLLDQLGLDLVTTYWEPDGEFPDHEPNPLLPENRQFIIDKVRAEGADLGIAWDGDADRCFFIDDTGGFVDGDFMTALLAESILEKQPGADILYDVRASRAVPDLVTRLGGTAHVNRVGHAFFKRRMRDEGGAFGGEVSGHYYFADFYNADSGTIPALLILELLSKHDAKLSELLAPLRERYFISGEINSEVADTAAKMAEIEERYGDGEITTLDGISVDYEDWHFNVRPSNTEPLLRLNLESLVSESDMERRRDEVSSSSARDPPPLHPHAVRRGARQLLPDRRRPADARRHRPELRPGARRARHRAARARAPDRPPRADRHHAPAPRPHGPRRDPRPALERGSRHARPPGTRARGVRRLRRARRRARRVADAAARHPARRRDRAARRCRARSAPGAAARRSTGSWPTATRSSSPAAPCRRCTGPGTRRPTPCSGTPSDAS